MDNLKAHWDTVWQTKAHDATSWYQEVPVVSLQFLAKAHLKNTAPLIDIGSGASSLLDAWLSLEFRDLTALDIAASAFMQSKQRLGVAAARVIFVEANVLNWQPERRYQLWHDRAVFHFLTDADTRKQYINTLMAALEPGGFFHLWRFFNFGAATMFGSCSATL